MIVPAGYDGLRPCVIYQIRSKAVGQDRADGLTAVAFLFDLVTNKLFDLMTHGLV